MPKIKREFLVEDVDFVSSVLESKSASYEFYPYKKKDSYVYHIDEAVYVLERYKKNLKTLNILVVISQNLFTCKEFENLQEITGDKRYSKEYLEVFGNPKQYEFNVEDVFKKCDSIGSARMDLHFLNAMNSAKVFRVLLYRFNQLFSLHFRAYNNGKIDFDILENSFENLKKVFHLSKGIFHKKIHKKLTTPLESLYLFLNETEKSSLYFLNFESFIWDNSKFFETKKADEYIYFFISEKIYKSIQRADDIAQSLDTRSSINKQFVSYVNDISISLELFSSILSKDEITDIKKDLQILKLI